MASISSSSYPFNPLPGFSTSAKSSFFFTCTNIEVLTRFLSLLCHPVQNAFDITYFIWITVTSTLLLHLLFSSYSCHHHHRHDQIDISVFFWYSMSLDCILAFMTTSKLQSQELLSGKSLKRVYIMCFLFINPCTQTDHCFISPYISCFK